MSHTTSILYWPQLFSILKFEIENRAWENITDDSIIDKSFKLSDGKKISLLLQLPIVCEGFLKTVIQYYWLESSPSGTHDIQKQLSDFSNNPWRDLTKEFQTVYHNSLQDVCDNEDTGLYNSISKLFKVRNLLNHGQDVMIEYERRTGLFPEIEIKEVKTKDVSRYLVDTKVISTEDVDRINIFQNEKVLLHFFDVTNRFLSLRKFREIQSIDVLFTQIYSGTEKGI